MFGCDQRATVWNRSPEDTFIRTIIPVKIRWKQKFKRDMSGLTESVGTITVVIVPYTDKFVVHPGDYMALGIRQDEITNQAPNRENDVFERLKPNCIKVTAVLDAIGPMGRHYKIEGV